MGFLKYGAIGDYATASRFLQFPPGENVEQLTKEFRMLYPNFQGGINLLSDDPNGTVDAGLPPGQVRAGVLTVDGAKADVILVRVDDPVAGKIWLISQETLASIPKLYARLESEKPTEASRIRRDSTNRPRDARDVIYAMALLAALNPARVVTSLAVDLSV